MKVLFITSLVADYLASCLWDGLQEVLGEENVVDAVDCPWLHKDTADAQCQKFVDLPGHSAYPTIVSALGGFRAGRRLRRDDEKTFDLLVLNASFNRDEDWTWARAWLNWLRPGGKVAYIEGWDAAWQVHPPEMPIDAAFRKEISTAVSYPYQPHHLNFAAPARWFLPDTLDFDRYCDVFFSGNPDACLPGQEVRRPMLMRVFGTRRTHHSVIATCRLGYDAYFKMLRSAKLALCPSGADLTDSLRTMEAVACGAIPVFVGYPGHIRDPWFPNEACISCSADTLAEHIDEVLAHDLTPRRAALWEHAKTYHTTAARARQMLAHLGMA